MLRGFESKTLKMAMNDPIKVAGMLANRAAQRVNHCKEDLNEISPKEAFKNLGKAAQKFFDKETPEDEIQNAMNDIKKETKKFGKSFMDGCANIYKFIKG
ncbi:MAG: hypothetical protein LBI77_02555 [Puniceicoccales bacterium]|jgi:molecular chaperone DnaK (HSP70)|nr:hypothetical protein [Puniceicoccales bacterium]